MTPDFPKPDQCVNCGETEEHMDWHTDLSVNGKDGQHGWVCDSCGHAHLSSQVCEKCHRAAPREPVKVEGERCSYCGYVHPKEEPGYNNKLDADEQITMEEDIAHKVFHFKGGSPDDVLDEEDCAQLGRDILKMVLKQFRPDLFDTKIQE